MLSGSIIQLVAYGLQIEPSEPNTESLSFEKATKESLFLDNELEPSAVMNLSIDGSRSEVSQQHQRKNRAQWQFGAQIHRHRQAVVEDSHLCSGVKSGKQFKVVINFLCRSFSNASGG